jgi:hypothetical protein
MTHAKKSTVLTLTCAALVCASLASPGSARADVDAWPFYQTSEDGTTVMYPFYERDGAFRMIFPFYYETNEGADTHFLWPMVKVADGRLERFAPFWFSAESGEFTIFPLIRRDAEGTLTTVPPMYTAADGLQTTVIPFYSHSLSAPNGARTERLSILWPLWSREIRYDASGDITRRRARALFFSQERTHGGRSLYILGLPVSERVE